ncbi:uncharacterized protein [Euphorbia lathyris]|uniref:uncharacterized protein n=1 Tax=Euphorbia lathyris TaxID=212925 RepID=UPI003313FF15
MVSIRRRKLKGPSNGRSSSLVPLQSILHGRVPEKPEQSGRPLNRNHGPSVGPNQPVKVEEEGERTLSPPAKRQKVHFQVDPENPMEVHTYLVKLKEDNKLELGPLQRSEEMSVKEWMEKCYPHIFRVFPQNPRTFLQFPDQSKQNEFLYCHYWLFLFELRNIVLMDYNVSPDYVESLGKVIKTLETQGFDCRFMRSEMLMVGHMMKQQQEIMLAERNLIAKRTVNLEKELADLVRKNGEAELDKEERLIEEITPEIEMRPEHLNKLQEDEYNGQGEPNKITCDILEQKYVEVILRRHKKMLAFKDEEGKRLNQIVEKINQFNRDKAAFSRIALGTINNHEEPFRSQLLIICITRIALGTCTTSNREEPLKPNFSSFGAMSVNCLTFKTLQTHLKEHNKMVGTPRQQCQLPLRKSLVPIIRQSRRKSKRQ